MFDLLIDLQSQINVEVFNQKTDLLGAKLVSFGIGFIFIYLNFIKHFRADLADVPKLLNQTISI